MAFGDLDSKDAVLSAIAEYDKLGQSEFLSKYGFRKSRSYFLILNNNSSDSKAIIGAAHACQFPIHGPLAASDFSGGANTVKRKLEAMGFIVSKNSINQHDGQPPKPVLTSRSLIKRTKKRGHANNKNSGPR